MCPEHGSRSECVASGPPRVQGSPVAGLPCAGDRCLPPITPQNHAYAVSPQPRPHLGATAWWAGPSPIFPHPCADHSATVHNCALDTCRPACGVSQSGLVAWGGHSPDRQSQTLCTHCLVAFPLGRRTGHTPRPLQLRTVTDHLQGLCGERTCLWPVAGLMLGAVW